MTEKNPGLAAVLSFLIPGLGQVYNGHILQGILLLIIYIIALSSLVVGIGFILVPIVWICGIVDAYREAEKFNKKLNLKK